MCKECTDSDRITALHCDKCRIEWDEDGSILGIHHCIQCRYDLALKNFFGTGSYEEHKKNN